MLFEINAGEPGVSQAPNWIRLGWRVGGLRFGKLSGTRMLCASRIGAEAEPEAEVAGTYETEAWGVCEGAGAGAVVD